MGSPYSNEELAGIYELGRMYFELGYFAPAERIFNGLVVVDEGRTPARLGLGLLKLERGLYQEAGTHFRSVLESKSYEVQAKLGLCAAFVAAGDLVRAKSILDELAKTLERNPGTEPEVRRLFQAYVARCRAEVAQPS
ncbi:MAG: hypothetical protein KDD69_11970 [Bdellovibrionales bacterium]|nr:hypothetical protein [Bdellovibrionales bacterium]